MHVRWQPAISQRRLLVAAVSALTVSIASAAEINDRLANIYLASSANPEQRIHFQIPKRFLAPSTAEFLSFRGSANVERMSLILTYGDLLRTTNEGLRNAHDGGALDARVRLFAQVLTPRGNPDPGR